jgi:hypothetical protein
MKTGQLFLLTAAVFVVAANSVSVKAQTNGKAKEQTSEFALSQMRLRTTPDALLRDLYKVRSFSARPHSAN